MDLLLLSYVFANVWCFFIGQLTQFFQQPQDVKQWNSISEQIGKHMQGRRHDDILQGYPGKTIGSEWWILHMYNHKYVYIYIIIIYVMLCDWLFFVFARNGAT